MRARLANLCRIKFCRETRQQRDRPHPSADSAHGERDAPKLAGDRFDWQRQPPARLPEGFVKHPG